MSDTVPAEATPGQAAREAFGELGADWYPGTPWNKLPAELRAQWDAAARAVMLMAQASVDYAELTRLREQLAEVRRIAYQGGQDAASVRQELLAYLEAGGGRKALEDDR